MGRQGPHDDVVLRAVRYMTEAREKLHVPSKVRWELRRKAWHVLGATMAVPVLLLLPLEWAIGFALFTMAVIVAAYYVVRRRSLVATPLEETLEKTVGKVILDTRRKGEDFPWASVLFLVSLIAIAMGTYLFHVPLAYAFAAFGILGMGDAASAIIGIAYGKNRIPWNPRKSIEGTVGGIIVGYFTAVFLASIDFAVQGQLLPIEIFAICLVGAVVGMLFESLPGVQDNLAIPLSAWGAMAILGSGLGLF